MAGSIEQRGPNVWRLVVSAGLDPATGRQRKVTRTVHGGKREADRELARLAATVADGKHAGTASGMTVAGWADVWMREHVERHLSARTADSYRRILDARVLPALGRLPLADVTPGVLKAWLRALASPGVRRDRQGNPLPGEALSGATQVKAFRVLASMLHEAAYRELLPANPCASVRPPRQEAREASCLDEAGVGRLLTALEAEPPRLRALVLLALGCGLRRGEVVGLRWRDVDTRGGVVRVTASAQLLAGVGQSLKGPKSEAGVRAVPLPAEAGEALAAWRRAQDAERDVLGSLWRDTEGFVFTQPDGSWLLADEASKQFRLFVGRHGLDAGLHLHELRHTAATMLLARRLPVRTVAALLGHARPETTLRVYAHALPSSLAEGGEIMQGVLSRKGLPA